MPADPYILIAGTRAWQVGRAGGALSDVAIPADADPREVAAEVSAALAHAGYTGQPSVLAVPSAWCLAGSICVEDLPKQDRKAMLFRLEEKLPLAAEGVVADFIPHRDRALGVCARLEQLGPLVAALEAANVAVQAVVPVALLAAQARAGTDPQPQLLLLHEDGQLNVVALDGGQPVGWSLVPSVAGDVRLQVDAMAVEFGTVPRVRACGVETPVLEAIARQVGHGNVSVLRDVFAVAASRAAAEVLAGKQRPWVDLRHGPLAIRDTLRLYRRPLNMALGAAAAFFLLLCGALLWRSQVYDRKTRALERAMAEDFHKEFPNFPTPPNVRAVVESEHRKLLTVAPPGAGGAGAGESALATLQAVLARMPDGVRVKVERMEFADGSFEMEGRLRAYPDVDVLAAALRSAGVEVPPPQVRRDSDGFWAFTLRGTKDKAGSGKPAAREAAH